MRSRSRIFASARALRESTAQVASPPISRFRPDAFTVSGGSLMSAQAKPNAATAHAPGRGRIYNSITETIGDTPLVRMARLPQQAGVKADILLKLEFFNPIASVKD